MKKTEVKNVALFARPGTFDLGNFDLSIGDLKVKPRTHIIVITDSWFSSAGSKQRLHFFIIVLIMCNTNYSCSPLWVKVAISLKSSSSKAVYHTNQMRVYILELMFVSSRPWVFMEYFLVTFESHFLLQYLLCPRVQVREMDLAAVIARLSSLTGVLPPGTEKLIQVLRAYPKSSVAISSIILIGGLWSGGFEIVASFQFLVSSTETQLKEILLETEVPSTVVR